ncbi:hypothetical protein ACFWY9_19620 [Amycolatopsis sp. NPDC059027]|uniref:hypothetical protein n=1 Tax=Amycolatopsis sp. NPDC059027 TaxID=3346709 RepID=UPI003672FF77
MQRRIATFVPRDTPPAWDRVCDRVRALVSQAGPGLPYDAAELMSVVARLAMFCDGHGIIDARTWLDASTIDWFLDLGCSGLSSHTRATYRARLRRLSDAVHGVDGAIPIPLSASDTARPYTSGEQASLWSWARSQPTDGLRTACILLLTLGLGCGLSTEEVIALRAGQVRVVGNGAVVIEILGRRARLVVCCQRWEQALAGQLADVESEFLFRPKTVRAKNLVSNLLGRAHRSPTTPPVKVARMRDTWLAEHLAAGTPLPVLVAAAGLDGLSSLDRLLPHLPQVGAQRAERHLRERA